MTARTLPVAEYPRLVGTALGPVIGALPEQAFVIVVEDDAGQIVACWMLAAYWHAEGLYVAPEHRGKAGAVRRLQRAAQDLAADLGITHVITGAADDRIRALLAHAGATALPEQYVLPLASPARKDPPCLQP